MKLKGLKPKSNQEPMKNKGLLDVGDDTADKDDHKKMKHNAKVLGLKLNAGN